MSHPDNERIVAIILNRQFLLSSLFRSIVYLTAAWLRRSSTTELPILSCDNDGSVLASLAPYTLRLLRAASGGDIKSLLDRANKSAVESINYFVDSVQVDRAGTEQTTAQERHDYVGVILAGPSAILNELTRDFPDFTIPDLTGPLPGSANENINFEFFRRIGF